MSTAKRNWAAGFYWIGVAMTLAFLAAVLASNTELVSRFEQSGFRLSWALAGAAILAFLAYEFSPSPATVSSEAEDRHPRLSTAWEPEF